MSEDELARLRAENAKLKKINAALMSRVERQMDQPNTAFALFEVAITLDKTVRRRTAEVQAALRSVEGANEALLKAKHAAERANAFKSTFLAFVSHDLLQPLNAARLNLSTLEEAAPSAEVRRFARQIDLALTSLEDLIRTLLDMSKLDAGAMRPDVAVVELESVLSPLREEFAPLAASRGLKLNVRPSRAYVRTDPLLLRRILQNLVTNSLRYTRRGGVLVGCRRRGAALRVEVWDTGPGIPRDRLEDVFKEFLRLDAPDAPAGGMGLGLAIVDRLARVLGAPVTVRSREGRGSVFSIDLPLGDDARVRARTVSGPARRAANSLAGTTVVVLDNGRASLHDLALQLRGWGVHALEAGSARDAVTLAAHASRRPSALLADDLDADGQSCRTAIERIRAELGEALPAVLFAQHGAEHRGASDAGYWYLSKPIRPERLRSLLSHLVTNR